MSVFFKYTIASAMFFCLAGIVFFAVALALSLDIPDIAEIRAAPGEIGVPVEYSEIPRNLVKMIIFIFDPCFFKKNDMNLSDLSKPFSGETKYSGKTLENLTISQNLSSFALSRHKSKINFDGFAGKIVESAKIALLTLKIEFKLKKERTIETFLNTVRFGNNIHGIFQATATIFNKKPSELTLHECAMLAVLMTDPDGFDPVRQPENLSRKAEELIEKIGSGSFNAE